MDAAPSSTTIVGGSSVAARVVAWSVTACAAAIGGSAAVTVIVKFKAVLLAPTASVAQTVTADSPTSVALPQIVRAAEQAPVPSASNAMPGGNPSTE